LNYISKDEWSLLHQADATLQIPKARVGAQWVIDGINLQCTKLCGAFGEGFVEPNKSIVRVM
jgi:hypothetical protein